MNEVEKSQRIKEREKSKWTASYSTVMNPLMKTGIRYYLHTHTHTHARARAHMHTHTHTHTYKHTLEEEEKSRIIFFFFAVVVMLTVLSNDLLSWRSVWGGGSGEEGRGQGMARPVL